MKQTILAKMKFRTIYTNTIELECALNGLLWQRFALSECFYLILDDSCSDMAIKPSS